MIEITPALTTHPIKKITKIIRERQQLPEKNHSQEHKNEGEDDSSKEPDQQHIDEIV